MTSTPIFISSSSDESSNKMDLFEGLSDFSSDYEMNATSKGPDRSGDHSIAVQWGHAWGRYRSGHELLDDIKNLPKWIKGQIRFVTEKPKLPVEVFSIKEFVFLSGIPTMDAYLRGLEHLPDTKNSWAVVGEVAFHCSDFKALSQVISTKEFIENLNSMLAWLESQVHAIDPAFCKWFTKQLNRDNFMMLSYWPHGFSFKMASALRFAGETQVDRDGLDAIQKFFQYRYGENKHHGKVLFLPTTIVDDWMMNLREYELGQEQTFRHTWSYMAHQVEAGLRKAYALVNVGNRWCVLSVDFLQRKILFGDIMGGSIPDRVFKAVLIWLKHTMRPEEFELWKDAKQKGEVEGMAIANHGLSSSAIIAANAVEFDVNSSFDCDCV
ncbi:hypothetical protein BGX21_006417, partial [Mortierella sp. AD011]